MLRLGNSIRLTSREIARFTEITGFEPVKVNSLDALDAYVEHCKNYYSGESKDARFLRWLIDREKSACLGVAA